MTSFGSFIRQLLRDVWSQKLRTFLTVFGIIWGTVAVALLLAVGEGVHREQIKSFAGLGDRIVIAWPSRFRSSASSRSASLSPSLLPTR